MKIIRLHPWVVPTIIFSCLVLAGGITHQFWGDDALTAGFAKNILKFGFPQAWDGFNLMGIYNGIDLNSALIDHRSSWLQFYLSALSFKLFGESYFSARLPFIAIAIISIPLLYNLAYKFFDDKRVALFSTVFLSLNVQVILFSYQARYYSLTILASILGLLSFISRTEVGPKSRMVFVIAAVLFFHSNFISSAIFFTALSIAYLVHLVISRTSPKEILRFCSWLITNTILTLPFILPWYLLLRPANNWITPSISAVELIKNVITNAWTSLAIFNETNTFPIIFLLIIALIGNLRTKKTMLLLSVVAIYLLLMAITTTFSTEYAFFYHLRYNLALVPILAILIGQLTNWVYRRSPIIGVFFFVTISLTNLATFIPPRFPILEYLNEIIKAPPQPNKIVADFLKKNANFGDTAFVSIDHNHDVLSFDLGNKIKFINRVSKRNKTIFPKNLNVLPEYIYDFREKPDWIILYGLEGKDGSFLTNDYRTPPREANLENDYEKFVIPVFFADMSRPEIYWRSFEAIQPNYQDQIFIFKKRKL